MSSRLKLVGLVAVPALLAAAVPAAYAVGTPQPHSTRAAITGDVLKGLKQDATRTGNVATGKRISVAISLTARNDKALDTFVAKVSNPRSSSYGHYLTKRQFAARFGRTDAEIKQLKDYLRAQGLTVTAVHTGNLLVDASGTAAQLEKAFGTKLSTWKDAASGRSFYANDTAPTLPTAIASLVSDVAGLNNRAQLHHQSASTVAPRNGPGGGYTPAQLKGGYNVSGTYTGSGQKIALIEFDGFQQSNITKYDTNYSLGSPTPTVQKVDGGSGALGDGQVEVELDIEVLHAIAPKANVTVFEGPNSDAGEVDTYQAIVDSGIPTTSISWGAAESARTTSNINAVDAVFKAGAAQGLGFYAASGDSGSDDAGDGGTSVDYPASDPYVTGVGGKADRHLGQRLEQGGGLVGRRWRQVLRLQDPQLADRGAEERRRRLPPGAGRLGPRQPQPRRLDLLAGLLVLGRRHQRGSTRMGRLRRPLQPAGRGGRRRQPRLRQPRPLHGERHRLPRHHQRQQR
ncbi:MULTISPECIES: protease pro-enzyme activation domain-containing protein [unclassified Streptomyces]|uniref:S53 family peptidase n=1 Tax=unclassified Streptomyces TaxID=2593676 RepID=UPI002E8211CD|nr:protease pro-enzyme activation domain-containing protein [Streptomyces sp. NBC_00589]WTI33851.1 protease pro-enzyme activation domain-containing protein [Streptomyces sp. NBC_00775]WUB32476.1 protease pro-enzyme activation domain-containing protein [Streptomyces sp. NBC_00589]